MASSENSVHKANFRFNLCPYAIQDIVVRQVLCIIWFVYNRTIVGLHAV